jgi:hypothetical protein
MQLPPGRDILSISTTQLTGQKDPKMGKAQHIDILDKLERKAAEEVESRHWNLYY